jgi:hypothetical protein
MNKLFYLGVLLVILILSLGGCALFPSYGLTPPDWINGTWSDAYDINTWTFTSDNALFSAFGITYDFAELKKNNSGIISDSSTSPSYSLEMSEDGITITYTFISTSSSTLDYGLTGMTLELIKQ